MQVNCKDSSIDAKLLGTDRDLSSLSQSHSRRLWLTPYGTGSSRCWKWYHLTDYVACPRMSIIIMMTIFTAATAWFRSGKVSQINRYKGRQTVILFVCRATSVIEQFEDMERKIHRYSPSFNPYPPSSSFAANAIMICCAFDQNSDQTGCPRSGPCAR